MTSDQFHAIAKFISDKPSRGRNGAYLVLIDGKTIGQAAKSAGCGRSTVFKFVQRVREIESLVSQVPTAQA